MYGGKCMTNYLFGMMSLSSACIREKIAMNFHVITNESLIQKARNDCVTAFLASDYTHLLFIDADIGFTANDVFSLLKTVITDRARHYDVLAGPYPKKTISLKKIIQAVKKGLVEEDHSELEKYLGDYTFLAPPGQSFTLSEPTEVLSVGTGFMLIPRNTFSLLQKRFPERVLIGQGNKKIPFFFDCTIDSDTGILLSEARFFCHSVREAGGKVRILPFLKLSHQGLRSFGETDT